MPSTTFTWISKDGLRLTGSGWMPMENPMATIYLVHGLGEHHGRYDETACFFNQAGFALVAFDQRGHGKSEGQRGHTPDYDTLLVDLQEFLAHPEIQTKGPRFLYGHSFGGGQVLNYLLRENPDLAGAIASSPLIQPAFKPPPWKMALINRLSHLLPRLSLKNDIETEGLTRVQEEVGRYDDDELNHDRVSLKLGSSIFEGGDYALDNADRLETPLLLMHGEADPITAAESSRAFAAIAGPLCELRIWKDCFHELHNELNKEEILTGAVSWMINRLRQ